MQNSKILDLMLVETFRRVREEIKERVASLVFKLESTSNNEK